MTYDLMVNGPPTDIEPMYQPTVAYPVALPDAPTPLDWVVLLMRQLQARRPYLARWQRYYDGDHPLSFFTPAFREAFGRRFERFSANFALLVVDGMSERMEVQGFRFKDPQGDADLWDIWQDNDLDAASQQAHTEALIKGVVYALVEPRAGGRPVVTIEDASSTIVATDLRDRRNRLAGLKTWLDASDRLVVFLYLPGATYTWRSRDRATASAGWYVAGEGRRLIDQLQPYAQDGQRWPIPNPMGVVPLVPILNRPLLDGTGRSEIEPITSNQDAINYYRAGAIVAARYVALPQRYALNIDLEMDPDTGRPKRPFVTTDGGPADLWTMGKPDPDEPVPPFPPSVGQFPAADITPYIRLIEAEVWQMAAISRMPYQELLGQPSSIPQSGEGLKSSEAPLLRKIGKAEVHFGEGWEEVMRVALRAQGDDRADLRTAETIWAGAETRNEAVRTDAVVKQYQAGLIDEQTGQEALGYSPQQIARMAAGVKARQQAKAASVPLPPSAPGAMPVDMTPAPTGPRMSPTQGP